MLERKVKINEFRAEPLKMGYPTIHVQRQMRSRSVVVVDVLSENTPQVLFIEHDDVIETLATN